MLPLPKHTTALTTKGCMLLFLTNLMCWYLSTNSTSSGVGQIQCLLTLACCAQLCHYAQIKQLMSCVMCHGLMPVLYDAAPNNHLRNSLPVHLQTCLIYHPRLCVLPPQPVIRLLVHYVGVFTPTIHNYTSETANSICCGHQAEFRCLGTLCYQVILSSKWSEVAHRLGPVSVANEEPVADNDLCLQSLTLTLWAPSQCAKQHSSH